MKQAVFTELPLAQWGQSRVCDWGAVREKAERKVRGALSTPEPWEVPMGFCLGLKGQEDATGCACLVPRTQSSQVHEFSSLQESMAQGSG